MTRPIRMSIAARRSAIETFGINDVGKLDLASHIGFITNELPHSVRKKVPARVLSNPVRHRQSLTSRANNAE